MHETVRRVGFRAGLAAFAFAVAYDVVQILQIAGALQFPLDEILIYGTSLCIVVPFVLEMLALHHLTPPRLQFWSHAALLSAVMYAVFVTANYVVQLATVVPAKIRGETAGILEQTPHSMFWNFDAIGYIWMGLSTLFAVRAFNNTGFERRVRWALTANTAVTPLIAVVYFYPRFSTALLFLGFPWAITAPLFMLMVARAIARRPPPMVAAT
jgi:hypothetical protein